MIAAWMLFAIEISALLFGAAWLAERALLSVRRPVRGVWVVAIVGANFLPLLLSRVPTGLSFAEKFSLAVNPDSLFTKLGTPLLVLWGLAIAVGLFVCLSAVWRMARTRPLWKTEHVDNTPVLVSHDIGPALVGVLQYSIVIPQWAYSLEERARTLLLTHEREHARHYDPLLLASAVLAVVIAPWNVFNWLFLKRLHLAVELDCDQRVLRVHPDARGYGELLLNVAERVLPSVMPAAAFVEHGASLETRLNAMTEQKKSGQGWSVVAGMAGAVLLVATACVMPRPIIIVVQPTVAALDQTHTARTEIAPKPENPAGAINTMPDVVASAAMSGATNVRTPPQLTIQKSSVALTNWPYAVLSGSEAEVRPVRPGARVMALDAAENERMRTVVTNVAPRTLGVWPRGDSALFVLFDASGNAVKQIAAPLSNIRTGTDPLYVVASLFMLPESNGMESASHFTIDHGEHGQVLRVPLQLFTAYLLPGLPIPKTRAEVTPSREAMLAMARAAHPEVLSDTAESMNVSVLLFDTRGVLLKSAAVTMETGPMLANGAYNNEYDRQVWRKAFGAAMDSGTVVQNGTLSFLTGKPLLVGPTKIMYVMKVRSEELRAFDALARNRERNWTFGGASSFHAGRGLVDVTALESRLRTMVATRVPDAYGDWARSDSAVVFLFDADDQLIARKTGGIPRDFQYRELADYISLRVLKVPADDIDHVGWTRHVTSESGRVLDRPLVVVWGKLSAEATRKLRQAQSN